MSRSVPVHRLAVALVPDLGLCALLFAASALWTRGASERDTTEPDVIVLDDDEALALELAAPVSAPPRAVESAPSPHGATRHHALACSELTTTPGYGGATFILRRAFDADERPIREEKVYREAGVAEGPFQNDPTGSVVFHYDASGRLVRRDIGTVERSIERETYTYDRAGHELVAAADDNGDGRADWLTLSRYDRAGRLVRQLWSVKAGRRSGPSTWYFYDANGRLEREAIDNEGDGVAKLDVHYAYDAAGELVERREVWRDGLTEGDDDHFAYDERGRRVTETDRLGLIWTTRYDDHDNVIERVQSLRGQDTLVRITYDYSCFD